MSTVFELSNMSLNDLSRVPFGIEMMILSLINAGFISMLAQVSIQLPAKISMVPITGQTLAINLIPAIFGWKIGVFASILYYVGIGIGLPIGAKTQEKKDDNNNNSNKLLGPTGGYLIGFIVGSLVIGMTMDYYKNINGNNTDNIDFITILVAMFSGNIIIFVFGLLYLPFGLSYKTNKKMNQLFDLTSFNKFIHRVLMYGLIPFIPGDLIKVFVAATIYYYLCRVNV